MSNPLFDELRVLARKLETQDNRITADPIFLVQQTRRIYGVDSDYGGESVWLDEEGNSPESEEELARLNADADDPPKGWSYVGYIDIWEYVTAFLTEAAANAYIQANRHNLHGPVRVYAASGYRNPEWQLMRKLPAKVLALQGKPEPLKRYRPQVGIRVWCNHNRELQSFIVIEYLQNRVLVRDTEGNEESLLISDCFVVEIE